MYIYIYTYAYTYTYIYIYIYAYKYMYTYTYIHMHIYTYAYTYIYIYMYVCVCICMCTYVCIYMYIYIYIFIHKHVFHTFVFDIFIQGAREREQSMATQLMSLDIFKLDIIARELKDVEDLLLSSYKALGLSETIVLYSALALLLPV